MIDLVIGGPDMSGTSTQVKDLINFFKSKNKIVRDISGTEIDALFHAEIFKKYNSNYVSLKEFLNDKLVSEKDKKDFIYDAVNLLTFGSDLKIASMLENDITTYINPDSADVWIMEEPTKRGSGQTNRTLEQNRSKFNAPDNQTSGALCHQVYRSDEFYRFRKVLREKNKIIIRSRSEESACYQIYDPNFIRSGITREKYIDLPGNKIAFSNPPTHLFIVCGPENWNKNQYLLASDDSKLTLEKYRDFRLKRSANRLNLDDFEKNMDYQLLVNKRYSSNWINKLYSFACSKHNSKIPEILKFNIYDSREKIRRDMENILLKLIE